MRSKLLVSVLACAVLATSFVFPAESRAVTTTNGPWVGFYVPGAPLSIAPLSTLESQVGVQASVSNYFQNTSQGFTLTQARNASSHGSIPLITLEFWNPANGVNQPTYSLKSIAGGSWDAYLHQYARDARSFGSEVWLRPLHEMNGNWYPWGGTVNGNSSADFIAAWRHMKDIFAAEGATNVKFVWSPNCDSVPGTSANSIASYWPGDGYVDYIGLDGYNFGGSGWRSFGGVFGGAYATVTSLSGKPIFIAETACSEVGGNKAAWIADMFQSIRTSYSRITGVTWFNANKECDWRVESSSASLASFVSGLNPAAPPVPPVSAQPPVENASAGAGYTPASPVSATNAQITASATGLGVEIANGSTTYAYEGVTYSVSTSGTATGKRLYRFYSMANGILGAASAGGRDVLMAKWSATYRTLPQRLKQTRFAFYLKQ